MSPMPSGSTAKPRSTARSSASSASRRQPGAGSSSARRLKGRKSSSPAFDGEVAAKLTEGFSKALHRLWRSPSPRNRGEDDNLANPRAAEGERRGRAAVAAGELRLIGDSAVRDAIGKAGVGRLAAEVEVGLAGMAHRPFADAVVEIEQAGLVGDLGARLGRNQS